MSNDLYPPQNNGDSLPEFLENLPSSIPRYSYEGMEQLLQIHDLELDRFERSARLPHSDNSNPRPGDSPTEYILFDIDPSTLEHDFLNPDEETPLFLCSSFDTIKGLLLVKMVTPEHSQAIEAFDIAIFDGLRAMNLHRAVYTYSGTTIKGNGRGKQGDHGWGPLRPPRGYPRRPAVALEVAVSEAPAKLKRDVDFWVDPSQGNANIAITLRVNRKKALITIEKWQWVGGQSQRTAYITVEESADGEDIQVTGSPLTIPFHLLFLRPISSPIEKDIIMGDQELKDMAELIWAQPDS